MFEFLKRNFQPNAPIVNAVQTHFLSTVSGQYT